MLKYNLEVPGRYFQNLTIVRPKYILFSGDDQHQNVHMPGPEDTNNEL